MARTCADCGARLGLFRRGPRCVACEAKHDAELQRLRASRHARLPTVQRELVRSLAVTEETRAVLKGLPHARLFEIYNAVYTTLEEKHELTEADLSMLSELQKTCGLSDQEVGFNTRIRPYQYALVVREKGELPAVQLSVEGGSRVPLRNTETAHFADPEPAVLLEPKAGKLEHGSGSHGISFPVPGQTGARYRAGSHSGHFLRADRLDETSRGQVVVTSQRLLLHPLPGRKSLDIPVRKLLSYHCYSNGVELYRQGRQKGYFLQMADSGSVEVVGLCLSFLLSRL